MVPWRTWPALFLLGMASGLPNPLLDVNLSTWLTNAGWSTEDVLLIGYVGLPFLLKPLWAPLVDRWMLWPRLGRRRSWLVASQVVLIAGLCGMAAAGSDARALLIGAACLAAVASATQDLAFNAATAEVVPADRLGLAVALSVWGYRAAMVVATALAPALASGAELFGWHLPRLGWGVAYLIMGLLLIPGLLASLLLPEPIAVRPPTSLAEAYVQPITAWIADFGGRKAFILLVVVVYFKLADQLAAPGISRFLAERFDPVLLGVARAGTLPAAAIGAALAAGVSLRFGLPASMWIGGVAMALSNLCYWAIAGGVWTGPAALHATLWSDTICGSMASTAFVAWLMARCRPGLAATQYALLSALSTLARFLALPFLAAVILHWGWGGYFLLTIAAAVPGLLVLRLAMPSVATPKTQV